MAGSSQGYHEAESALSAEIKDRHRAIASLMEELEAVDWYDQRVAAATDSALADLLAHNRDEEKEHASMVLEWIRRRDACWDEHLHRYLFTDAPLLDIEAHAEAPAADAGSLGDGTLGVGSLKGTTNL